MGFHSVTEAVLAGASKCVVPGVGCGVFKNDPGGGEAVTGEKPWGQDTEVLLWSQGNIWEKIWENRHDENMMVT